MSLYSKKSILRFVTTLLIPAVLFAALGSSVLKPQGSAAATSSLGSTSMSGNYSSMGSDETVEHAWELARQSGVYAFRSDMTQTADPALSMINAGRDKQVDRLFFEGSINQTEEQMEMTLWQNSRASQGLSIKVENGQTYGRMGTEDWQEADNVGEFFAPGGDPLGFLSGATNIQADRIETRQFDGGVSEGLTLKYQVYTFDFDGPRFADHMRAQMEHTLQEQGKLPSGINLDTPDTYKKMTGEGEIWVDVNGLPTYIQVDLVLPDRPNGDHVTAQVQTELYNFDLEKINAAQTSFLDSPSTWVNTHLPQTSASWQKAVTNMGLWLLLAVIAIIVLRYWRSKKVYGAMAGFMIVSMMSTPLMQSNRALAFSEEQATMQAEQSARVAQAEEEQQAREYVTTSSFDPHANPMDTPSVHALEHNFDTYQNDVASSGFYAPEFSIQASGTITTTDSDNDGLSDADETLWQTCAYLGAPVFCDGVTDSTDSDGDGLTDGDEVNRVGTIPAAWDTDGDGITDTVEIQGYTDGNGVSWYLDAYESDSNKDGILDGVECPAWSITSANPNPGSACPDTDGDGTPDIYDVDNDGDGIHDDVDTSPFTVPDQVYNQENPFKLHIDGLLTGEPVHINLQMRPAEPEHLNYFGQVMDWPSGDRDGQIQRVLDTTWANTSDLSARSTASDAGYGDIRLVPFLEVTIPYQEGHYGNLPLKPEYVGTTRTLGDPVSNWVDQSVLNRYGITVQDVDAESGDLVAYVPLNLLSSGNGGEDVAFTAQMMYWPQQSVDGTSEVDWGSDHSYRLVWFVQMLTDACPNNAVTCEDAERQESMSIIQIYDDDWYAAGLEIVEDRGLKVGLMYEDPAQDTNLGQDQQLWNASWLLGTTFLRGRDCPVVVGNQCSAAEQDGQRDVTIDNAVASLNSWASNSGDTSYLEMEIRDYTDETFMGNVMMTDTVQLLDDKFTPYVGQTTPTILFLTERTRRSYNLDDGSINNGLFSVDFDPDGTDNDVPVIVMAGMNWASYFDADETAGVDWQSYDPYEYMDYLDWQLQSDEFFTAASNAAEDIDEAEGKRLWAQIYYIALYSGATGLAEINHSTAWTESPDIPETELDSWPTTTFYGATYVSFSFLNSLKSTFNTTTEISFWRQLKYAFSYNYSFYTSKVTRSLKTIGRATFILTALTATLIVTGAVMFAVGYFSNNESLVKTATVVLNIATTVVLGAWLLSIMRTAVAIIRVSAAATNSLRVFSTLITSLGKASRAIGWIGLVIAVAAAVALFLASVISGDIKPGTIQFNIALSLLIAQVVVIVVLFILELVFGIVATVVILLLFIIDAILAIFGEKGVIEYITEWLAGEIYNVDYVIFNLEDANRLDFSFTGFDLVDPEEGFTTANDVIVSMQITTTLDTHGDSDGKRATFRYALTQSETNIHNSLSQNTMNGEWATQGNYIQTTQSTTIDVPVALSDVGAGVNQDLSGHLYLNEGLVIPYEGCWRIPLLTIVGVRYINVDCDWYDTKVTNHINVGDSLIFDILPDTISKFVSLNWTMAFTPQHDYDNDGLLSEKMGGVDPNDKYADIDGDGLTDAFEFTVGTDPQHADTDRDGLTDSEELTYRTNPLAADSDADGLDDYTETVVGWMVVYDNNNHQTRIWSDPNIADADNDTLTDLEEFVFGFNPWTATDPSLIDNLIAFDNIHVNEANAPMMLFQFEEPSGSNFFNDDYGRGYTAKCNSGNCPTLIEDGKFGKAVEFDSGNGGERITVENVNLSDTSFTIAGWVNHDSPAHFDPLVHMTNVDITFDESALTCGNDQTTIYSSYAFDPNQWHHFACVYDKADETLSLYVNGILEGSTPITLSFDGSEPVELGYRNLIGFSESMLGKLDEVAIFQSALSVNEIANLIDHKYLVNDLLVAPGDPLIYSATVSNTHPSQPADGLITADARYFDPAIGVPDVVLGFENDEKISYFSDSVGESTTATCIGELTCPTKGVGGAFSTAVQFDGIDDYIVLPVLGKDLDEYTLAFWVYLSNAPASNAYILDTESDKPGALDIYINPAGHMVFDIAGSSTTSVSCKDLNNNNVTCPSSTQAETAFNFAGSNKNTWWFVGIIGDLNDARVYINPDNGDSFQLKFDFSPTSDPIDQIVIGPGRLGNNLSGNNPYNGRLDELSFYNQTIASPTATNNKELSEKVYHGIYNFDYIGYSAKQVNFLLKFNDTNATMQVGFVNDINKGVTAHCLNATTCPTSASGGIIGNALFLDGIDDKLTHDKLDFVKGDYSLAGWFKTGYALSDQTILGAADPASGAPGVWLYLSSTGEFRWVDRFPTGFSGGTTIAVPGGYNDNTWHHFLAIKNGTEMTLIMDGSTTYTSTTSGHGNDNFNVTIGYFGAGYRFAGYLDELIIIPSAVADGTYYHAAETLMNSHYPPVAIDDNFKQFSILAQTATTVQGSATIDNLVTNSQIQFNQEVEAALQLQSELSYPIIDSAQENLVLFLPFEEVPHANTFINYGENDSIYDISDFVCDDASGDCPASGLRGKVGRALFFDGIDDQVTVGPGSNYPVNTIAAWIYGDRGTIVKTSKTGGLELDFNRFRVWWTHKDFGIYQSSIPLDLPENQWVHVVATYDQNTGISKVYVNGVLAGTANITPSGYIERPITYIGANNGGTDPFHGYIDDLRGYDIVLSASQVATLYNESTPQLNFEFDEDENASVFLDKSINELVAEPVPQVCYRLELVSMNVNSLTNEGSTINLKLDNNLLAHEVNQEAGLTDLNTSTLLCDAQTLEVSVAYNGTTTSLGTSLITTVPTTTTVNFSSGGDNLDLTYAEDADPIYRVNPAPGTDGKIGNTAVFDGEGYLTVEGANAVNNADDSLTIMMWVMPDDLVGRQRFIASARTNSINGFGFGLNANRLLFTTWGRQDVIANATEIEANIWQQVAVVLDSNNTARFYVDGVLQQTLPSAFIDPNLDDVLMIGGTTEELSTALNESFRGQLDELQVFNRALSGAEIFAFYQRELRWYRDRGTSIIKIDADLPQLSLLGDRYYDNSEVDLVLSAVDVSSSVQYVDYAMKSPSDGDFSDWASVALCADAEAQGNNATWCLSFDPTTLGGEGAYEFKFRAFDAVGNETEIQETIYIDATGPDVTTNYNGQWAESQNDANDVLAWTTTISGTVSDPNIGNTPGSGIRVETESSNQTIAVTLYNKFGKVAGEGTQTAQIINGTWSVNYLFVGTRPHGEYTIETIAYDNVGNVSTVAGALSQPLNALPNIPGALPGSVFLAPVANSDTILLDVRPPSVELNSWNMTSTITTTTLLSGTAFELLDAGGAVAQYHFEETNGTTFEDSSYNGSLATCAFCPTLGQPGIYGLAPSFDGVDDTITLLNVANPAETSISTALWFNLTDVNAKQVLLSQTDGTGTGADWLYVENGLLKSMLGGIPVSTITTLLPNTWYHAALSFDGTDLSLYLDGSLETTVAITMQASDGTFLIGNDKTLTYPTAGQIDELAIYASTLNDSEVYELAQTENIGLDRVEVWLEPFSFAATDVLTGTQDWQPASGVVQGSDLSEWQYLLDDLEGYYRINLRASDAFGNTSGIQRPWRGVIDTRAPRINFLVQATGYGSAASTTFTFTMDDLFLNEESVSTPCDASNAPLTIEYDENTGLVTKISGSCRIVGHNPSTQVTVSACDLFGHCSSEIRTMGGNEPSNSVLIREPELNENIIFSGDSIPVEIGAYAAFGRTVSSISLSDQNGLIDSIAYTGTVTDTIWTTSWLPPAPGVYTLTATMTDSNGNTPSDTIQVILDINDAPIAAGDVFTITEDSPNNLLNVLANDTDLDGDALTILNVGTPDQGGTVLNGTDVLTYTPAANFYGLEVFTYTVTDGLLFDTGLVTVTVTNVNDAPIAADDTFTVDEDSFANVLDVLMGDTDPDEDNLTISSIGTPDQGGTVLYGTDIITYTPAADFSGVETFTYEVSDGNGGIDTATVTITVTQLNDAPQAVNDTYTGTEDAELTISTPGVLANDMDNELDPLTSALITQTVSGTVSLASDGSFTYTPNAGICGTDTFTYQASDGILTSNVATVSLAITCRPPVANAGGPYTLAEGETIQLTGTGTTLPSDPPFLTYEWDYDYYGTTFDVNATGATPVFDTAGLDGPYTYTLALRVTDQTQLTDVATTTLTILNTPPTITLIGDANVDEGAEYVLDFGAYYDPGQDTWYQCNVHWGDGNSEPCIDVPLPVTHIYLDGPQVFTITVDLGDEDGYYPDAASLAVTVNNIAPVITFVDNTGPIDEGGSLSIIVSASDVAGSNDPLTYAFDCDNDMVFEVGLQSSNSGTCSFADDGSFTVNVQVDDGDGGVTFGSGNVFVENREPTLSNVTITSVIDEGGTATLTGNMSDISVLDSFTLLVVWGDGTQDTYSYPAGNTAFTETHVYVDDDPTGSPSDLNYIDLSLWDDDGGLGTDSVSITVNNVAPTLAPGQDQVLFENDILNLSLALSDPGLADTYTAVIDWGDGSAVEPGLVANGMVSASHLYPTFGSYNINVTLTDDDTGVGTSTLTTYVVHGFLESCVYGNTYTVTVKAGANLNCDLGGLGTIDVNYTSLVNGNVQGGADVLLGNYVQVTGDVTAVGNVTQTPTTVVNGTVTSGGTISVVTQIGPLSINPGTTDINVNKNQTLTLEPGAYGALNVKKNATLILSDGTYTFQSIQMLDGANLQLNLSGGGLIIEVADFVSLKKNVMVVTNGGSADEILWVINGSSVQLGQDGEFLGTFIAPQALIEVFGSAHVTGALYGQEIILKPNTQVDYAPALAPFIERFVQ